MDKPATDRLLTASQVAGMLQVSVDTVYDWGRRGEIPTVKIGGARRFPERALREFIHAQTSSPRGQGSHHQGRDSLGSGLSVLAGGDEAAELPSAGGISAR